MYIIVSNNLKTNEVAVRAQFNSRMEARKNLLKEAQSWLTTFKPGQEWEILVVENQLPQDTKIKYFVMHSNKNEDDLFLYERLESVNKGWIYTEKVSSLDRLLIFSVLEVENREWSEPRFVSEPTKVSNTQVFTNQKNLIADLKVKLATRRADIESTDSC